MATGQFYPTSLLYSVAGTATSRYQEMGVNERDSISINNLSSGTRPPYQELADIVNEYSVGNLVYNSNAKYPTDNKVGTEIIATRTDTYTDFNSVFVTAINALQSAWNTAITVPDAISATEKTVAANAFGNNFNNLQSKLEKIARKVNELNNDVASANAGTVVSATASRYPSGQNRFTNTTGGI